MKTPYRWLGWLALLLAGCAGAPTTNVADTPPADAVPRQLQARQVIVTLAPAPAERWASIREALARTHGLRETGAFPLSSLGVLCVVFQVPGARPLSDVMAQLRADPSVESVQVNQVFQSLQMAHGDPYARLQYGPRSIRADVAHRWATGKGVRVAIVDTGVDTTHPDLKDRVVKTATFVQGGESTFTEDMHGTAVAGVIAADADNQIGIFGVAPDARLLVAKACWHRAPRADRSALQQLGDRPGGRLRHRRRRAHPEPEPGRSARPLARPLDRQGGRARDHRGGRRHGAGRRRAGLPRLARPRDRRARQRSARARSSCPAPSRAAGSSPPRASTCSRPRRVADTTSGRAAHWPPPTSRESPRCCSSATRTSLPPTCGGCWSRRPGRCPPPAAAPSRASTPAPPWPSSCRRFAAPDPARLARWRGVG